MASPKENPKRWYIVMVFCMVLSFFAFVVGPRIGYAQSSIQAAAILIGLWAPVLGIMGLRAELMTKKQE